MEFTTQEIEKALSTELFIRWHVKSNLERLQQSINYPEIINYLTGQSNSLQAITPDDKMHEWQPLLNLITSLEPVGAREQRVLDVIYHPDMWTYFKYTFDSWLFSYLLKHPTKSALNAVINQLKQRGNSDQQIFELLASSFSYEAGDYSAMDKTPVKEYLFNHLQQSTQLFCVSQFNSGSVSDWSFNYFQLLEEANPRFAAQYIGHGLMRKSECVVLFHSHRKGGYMPTIIKFIKNPDLHTVNQRQIKFSCAFRLYEHDPNSYTDLMTTVAQDFIEYYLQLGSQNAFEGGLQVNEFQKTDLYYTPFSTLSLHLLLKYKKDTAMKVWDDWVRLNAPINPRSLNILFRHTGQGSLPYLQHALKVDAGQFGIQYYQAAIELLTAHFAPDQYADFVWTLINNKSKPLRALVAKVLAQKDSEAESKAISLLGNKNAETRLTAATILNLSGSATAKEAVISPLNKETNDNVRDLLVQIAADALPSEADQAFITSMVESAEKRGKLSKPVEEWLDESALPPLFFKNGEQVSPATVRFLLYRMSRVKGMRSDPEARYIIQQLDKERAAEFSLALIQVFKEKGGKPEHKFLMALAALTGSEAVVDKIRTTVNNWIDENRFKMAENGVVAMALQGSDKALRWVEWYSRKYKSKKANIGAAALAALENAAEELGISTHELGDKIVPDFGFEGLFKHFTVNGEEYRAFIDSDFKIAFFNEDNKKLKTIPAAADESLKEQFKAIAKEVRDIVKSQSSRLEYYLIIQRRWSFENWQRFFLQNPVMFIYATKLLWGVYEHDGTLVQTFLCNEDTSMLDVNQDEITPDPSKFIGIVHPSQLGAELLQQWKKLFFDLSVESIFPQLDRALPDLSDIDLTRAIITKFDGRQMKEGSTRSTLERYGWHRGPVADAGMLESFNLYYPEKNMEAVLEVEGIGAGYGWGGEEKLGRLYVMDVSKGRRQLYEVVQEGHSRLIPLKSVPGIFLHEMLVAVEAIKPVEKIT